MRSPVLQQQLHVAHEVEGRPRGGAVHQGGLPLARRQLRRYVDTVTCGASLTQRERDLAGHHDVLAVPSDHQAAGEQLVDRTGRLGTGDGALGRLHQPRGAVPLEVVDDRAGSGVELVHERGDDLGVAEVVGDRLDVAVPVAARLQPQVARERRDP